MWPCAGTWLALRSLKPLVSSVLGEFWLLGRLQKIPTEEGSGPLGDAFGESLKGVKSV